MVAAQVGSRWRELYNALSAPGIPPAVDEARHSSYQDLAYAALLSWSAVDPEASLAKLIGGLRRCDWPGLVESIRAIMDDTAGVNMLQDILILAHNWLLSNTLITCIFEFPNYLRKPVWFFFRPFDICLQIRCL